MMIKYYGSYPNVICLKFVMVSKKPSRSAEQPRLGLRGPVLSLNFQDGDSGFPLTTQVIRGSDDSTGWGSSFCLWMDS